jgi:hypothetical protein
MEFIYVYNTTANNLIFKYLYIDAGSLLIKEHSISGDERTSTHSYKGFSSTTQEIVYLDYINSKLFAFNFLTGQ